MSTVTYRHENSFSLKKVVSNIELKKALLMVKKVYLSTILTKQAKLIKIS